MLGPYIAPEDLAQDLRAIESGLVNVSFKNLVNALQAFIMNTPLAISKYSDDVIELELNGIPVATIRKIDSEGKFVEVEFVNGLVGKYPATETAAKTIVKLAQEAAQRLFL